MNRKDATIRVLELMEHYGSKDNSILPVEFFFYAGKQDDASNIAIELHKFGYEVYGISEPDAICNQWSVVGCTPKMNMDEESVTRWTDKMERLAEENNSVFDGWGTLIDPEDD